MSGFETTGEFSPLKPRRESWRAVIHNLSDLAMGRIILVPVDYELINERLVEEDGGYGDCSPQSVVRAALHHSILDDADRAKFEEHYGLTPGTIEKHGGRTEPYDATEPTPPYINERSNQNY